jgi:hypothetical protein
VKRIHLTLLWTDFTIPVSELHAGGNTFIFHKTHSDKNDDYLYIGIDNSVSYGHSRRSSDGGKTWTTQSLNTLNATGEYMMRLLLLKETTQTATVWTPEKIADPQHLIGYSGIVNGTASPYFIMELDPYAIDPLQPFNVHIKAAKDPQARWLDEDNNPLALKSTFADGVLSVTVAPSQHLAKVEIPVGKDGKPAASEVRFDYSFPVGATVRQRVNMAPVVSPPKGSPVKRSAQAHLTANGFNLENATVSAAFVTKPALRLVSLRDEYLQKNVLAHPEETHLFLTKIDGKRFGAEDWKVRRVTALSPTSIGVDLALLDPALTARLTISIDARMLQFGLKITNASQSPLSWKTAFPQIGGLQLSQNADNDYYLFPAFGGAIASQNVNLRTFYGDDSAWWQMVDLFSPQGGAGLMLRSLDATGLYKGVAMRKGEFSTGGGTFIRDVVTNSGMASDMSWRNSLGAGPGTSMDFEYLQYTRPPGGSFASPDAAIEMHSGDWHNAMQTYADWAHSVWKWRPFPSQLRDVWNIGTAGWGNNRLYTDDHEWRTDFIHDKTRDAAELGAWWQWSVNGPWQIPKDQLEKKYSALYNSVKTAFAIDPANGKLEYTYNPGDYNYNAGWGGLPALKKELDAIRAGGQLPTFYIDPCLADDNTALGQKYGLQYGIKYSEASPQWKSSAPPFPPSGYVTAYNSWNMCLDAQGYQDFVVQQTTRIVRDTGVSGIRFDQCGFAGIADFNPLHQHIFAEPGQNARLQATARLCLLTHQSVDKIEPGFVLMTEAPGYDHLAANLEGAIDYESTRNVFDGFRPVPLNVFRFYFPECKLFDLRNSRDLHGEDWRFWNATGTFGYLYLALYHRILKENGDAFGGRNVTPLAPSLAQDIYANQFKSGGKTITLLYNASGFTVDKPLLAAPAPSGFHYFDLLHGQNITPQNGTIAMELPPDKAAAIALLPKVLSVRKTAGGWQVQLNRAVPDAAVALCGADGAELSRQTITGTKVLLNAPAKGDAVYVKLFSGKYLLDATH